jgi:chromosome segregation ATPase
MTGRLRTAVSTTGGFLLTAALLVAAGCGDSDLEKAQKDAREAKATVKKLELSLDRAMREISDLKNELSVVRETRDELQRQVDQLTQERDRASVLAQQAEQVITHLSTRAEGQVSATAAMQKQIDDLKAVVADQQALIEELQKAGAVEAVPPGQTEGSGATDGNEPADGAGV